MKTIITFLTIGFALIGWTVFLYYPNAMFTYNVPSWLVYLSIPAFPLVGLGCIVVGCIKLMNYDQRLILNAEHNTEKVMQEK